ncbi:MAG: LolA family protein [Planctomycetota bacterium]|jgi:outer membrane lipoprotein-sorting protein
MSNNETDFKELISRLNVDTKPNPAHRESLRRKILSVFDETCKSRPVRMLPAGTWQAVRRSIMTSKVTKLAAAAVIIIAVMIGLNQSIGPIAVTTPAFGEVVEPFLSARTATFKATMKVQGGPTQTFEGAFMEPCRMRQTTEGAVVISDLEKGKVVTLIAAQKRAIVWEVVNMPENPGELNPFLEVRRRILEAKEAEDESVEFLGEREVEGRAAIGYHVKKAGFDITVWADAETKIPVTLESTMGPVTSSMSDIVFNVDLPDSVFSLEIPGGYMVHTLQMDGSKATEKDVIEMFRIWTEHMDGRFPSSLEMSVTMEFVQYQQKKMTEEGREPSEQKMWDKMMEMQGTIAKISRGLTFVQELPSECDWRYGGKGLKLGDSDSPIFRYRPEASETYRVIYGDLRVEDVAPENLPE